MNRSYYDMPIDQGPGRITGSQPPNVDATGPHVVAPHPRHRMRYEHETPIRPTRARSPASVHIPSNNLRPRSVLPPFDGPRRLRRRSSCSDSDPARHCLPRCARSAIRDTFTDSYSGVVVGTLGAVVGGFVAHEVSHATVRAPGIKARDDKGLKPDPSGDGDAKSRKLATLAGAVIGGLGANAIEKKFEVSRQRDRERRAGWVRRWGDEGGFWQNEWHSPFDHSRSQVRGRGKQDYNVVFEEKRPFRRSDDAYQW